MLAASFALISACVLVACAPTIHVDAPAMPALSPQQADNDTQQCTKQTVKELDPPPQLPDAQRWPCPPGSGFVACFTPEQDAVRQKRFKILHDDRDYCRDAYDRARQRASE